MTYQQPGSVPPRWSGNVLADLVRSGRLAWRLLKDPRVGTFAKLAVPVLAGIYVLSPVDLLPDVIPVLGQLDDVAIVALALRLFIQLAPPAVVAEHMATMAGHTPPAQGGTRGQDDGDVIEGDYRVMR